MNLIPHTYSEWADILELFKTKSDDEHVLEAMQQGSIEWQTGVAERFSKRLIDAVNYRMNLAADKLQKDIGRARGQEGAIVQALLSLRKEMAFLAKAINLPVLPDSERHYYLELVKNQADNIQKSLEESSSLERSGKLLSIVRNHRVNSF